jgi:hypothetical protein
MHYFPCLEKILCNVKLFLPGTGEIEGVDEAKGGGSRSTAGGQVAGKVSPELGVLVNTAQEHLLVFVLEGEVEGLGGEVPDHVGKVTTPEAAETLFLGDASEAVNDTCRPQNNITLIRNFSLQQKLLFCVVWGMVLIMA